MRKVRGSKIFAILCSILLVFSSIGPSVAFAAIENEPRPGTIKLDLKGENRGINYPMLKVSKLKQNGSGYSEQLYYQFSYEDNQFELSENDLPRVDLQANYQISLLVGISEWNENYENTDYTFIDQIIVTGEELLSLGTLEIPSKDQLKLTTLETESELFQNSNLNLFVGDGISFEQADFYVNMGTSLNLLVRNEQSFPITFDVHSIDSENKHYLISDTLNLSSSVIKLDEYIPNLVYLQFDTTADFVRFSQDLYSTSYELGTDNYVSKGKYFISYYSENGITWEGEIVADENTVTPIVLPETPNELKVSIGSVYADWQDSTELNIHFESRMANGQFSYNPYDAEFSGKILSGKTVISEFSTSNSYGNHQFSMSDYPSGEYTLYLETKVDDQTIPGTATFQYKAPYQELQGTLLKVKNGDSFVNDTTVTVYQNVDRYYEPITVETASADGEVFIPDAFLLKDQDYLLVVESASEKLLYVEKFIGQSQNEIILDSSTFKPFSLETNNLEEVTSGFIFGDLTLHKKVNSVEKIGTSLDTRVFWSGKTNEGTIGYEYLAPVDFEKGNSLKDLDWVSYKPAKEYEEFNAKLKFNGPANISELGYDEINVFYEKGFKPSFTLTVMDGNTSYEAKLAPSTNEVAFGEISGEIASVNEKMIYTMYTSELIKDSLRVSGPNIKLTYELKDSKGNTTQLETNQIYYIPLTEKLAEGSYTIKLVESTTNNEVLLFELEKSFEIGNESTADGLPLTIPFNIDTPYGQLQDSSWANLVIYELYNEGTPYESYGQIAHYEYNEDLNNFNITWVNRSFDPSKTYKVLLSVTNINSNTHILDIKDMTGEELVGLSESNPLAITDGLHKLVIDPTEVTSGTVSNPHYEIELYYLGTNSRNFYGYGKNAVYVADGTYGILANLTDDKVKKIFIEPNITVNEDTTVKLANNGLANVQVFNGEQKLPIFNISNQNHVNRSYNPDQLYDHFITKGNYETLSLLVGIESQYDTPWGYHLTAYQQNISQDTTYQFTGEIDGEIENIYVFDDLRDVQVEFNLFSDNFSVSGIYHAIPNPYRAFSLLTAVEPENPVRKYFGLFDTLNGVKPNYTLKDSNGKVLSSGYSTNSSLEYLYVSLLEALEEGTYTLEINIPTAPRKSIKLEKSFTVGESGPFVSIETAPKTTNEEEVTITGSATEGSTLTAKLSKDEAVVETKTVTTSSEGAFEVSFKPESDGEYSVEVINGDVSDHISFTIDRTAPEKAKDLAITESSEGLMVTWTGAEDVVSYKVAVKENAGEFVEAEAQKTTSFVIVNVKPGATYEVKVTSVDQAGNASVSDVTSFKVDDFVTTSVNVEDIRNSYSLVVIGDSLNVTLDGSYKEGYTAKAFITIDGEANEVTLTYNETTKKYEGSLTVVEGNKVIESVKGYIVDGDKQTDEKLQELNWNVGSTVTGKITDGTDAVGGVSIQLKGDEGSYKVTSNLEGTFEFKGIKPGSYNISSTVNGRTKGHGTVEVGESKVQALDNELTVDAYVASPVFKFVDSIEQKAISKDLLVRITGPNNFIVFGKISEDGQFVPFGNSQLSNLVTGPYTVTVYGDIVYQNTTEVVILKKDETEYTVTVNKDNVETKDIVISLPENVEVVNDVSLYSPSVSSKYNYQEGSYYDYYVQVGDDQTITIEDVIVAKDYYLNISVDGYMNYYKVVDLTSEQTLTPVLEQGREISGKVTGLNGEGIGFVYIYGTAGDTYSSAYTNEQGEYTLKGLSKNHNVNLYVSLQTYLDANETIAKGEENATKDIQLVKAGSITGNVVDKEGEPVQYASIYAYSNGNYTKWTRSAQDGTFSVDGLKEGEKYTLEISNYGYPSFIVEDVEIGDLGEITLQAEGDGDFNGEGNYLAVSKSTVVEGDTVSYTLGYQNNGEQDSTNVPVTITLPEGLELFNQSVQLNGKAVAMVDGKVVIPSVKAGESGKITFDATVKAGVSSPSLTAKAQITEEGTVLSATTSVVFVTLEAPAKVGTSKLKVYGTAKLGSTVEIYANNTLVGQSTVNSKWWYADISLPLADLLEKATFTLTAKVTNGVSVTNSTPVEVTYLPSVPTIQDVTVTAGWNGDVKLNPYTGVATFAITENTWMPTTIQFSEEIDSAKLVFLGKEFEMKKDGNTFTFNGNFGTWSTYGEQLLQVTFKKGDVEVTMPLMNIIVLIDPSGYVFEGSMDNRLDGVQAVVEVKENGEWVTWDAEKFGQVNPQVTDADGRYGWDVIHGEWRVIFTKDGYEPYISRIMTVPPAETELNVPMVKITDPVLETSAVTESDLSVTFDRYMDVESANIKLFEVTGNGNVEVTGTVEVVNQKVGYQSISTPADKAVGFAGQDSNGEDGFFAPDEAISVANSFKFKPTSVLKASTNYVLVVNGEIQDTEGRTLAESVEFEFTTSAAPGPVTPPPSGGGVTPPAKGNVTEINESDVTSQLNDSTKSTVTVNGSVISESQPTASVEITSEALNAIANAGKPLVINYGVIKVEVPAAVVKEASTNSSATTKFEVGIAKDAKVPGNGTKVSNVYEFTITANNKIAAFGEPIVITIPVDGSAVKDTKNVAAYYVNEDTNILEFVISKYENGAVTFKTKHFSKFVVVENEKSFSDTTKHWAKTSIESLASKGVVSGKSATTFAPEDSITRAEFASILTRMLNLPTANYAGEFSDVPTSLWASTQIEAAYSAGIVSGYNGKFNPNETITRQDMAAMIVRAIEYFDSSKLEGVSTNVRYEDSSLISSYAKDNVSIVSNLGIAQGKIVSGKQVFAPKEHATRAEAATMLNNLLDILSN